MKLISLLVLLCGVAHADGGSLVTGGMAASLANGSPTFTAVTATTVTISNLAVGGIVFSSTPANGRLAVDSANLFWDDSNNRLGIGNNSPATKLHMSSGTLTVDGTGAAMNVAGTTFTVANTGVIGAPSQPFIWVSRNTSQTFNGGLANNSSYWGTVVSGPTNLVYDAVASSDVVTVPAGMGGRYSVIMCVQLNSAAASARSIAAVLVNGTAIINMERNVVSGENASICAHGVLVLAAGDTVDSNFLFSATQTTTNANASTNFMVLYKLP